MSTEPFDAAVEAHLGYRIDELREVAGRMRVDSVAECMSSQGFEIPRVDIEHLVLDEYAETTTLLDIALAELQGEPVPGALPPSIPQEFIVPCIEEAESSTASVEQLDDLFADLSQDVSDRVGSNEKVIAARNQYQDCVAALGFETPDPGEGQRSDERVSEIMVRYGAGQLSREDALVEVEQLRDLQEREFAQQEQIERCYAPLATVELRVSFEEQERIIDDNPELIEGLADEYASLNADLIDALNAANR